MVGQMVTIITWSDLRLTNNMAIIETPMSKAIINNNITNHKDKFLTHSRTSNNNNNNNKQPGILLTIAVAVVIVVAAVSICQTICPVVAMILFPLLEGVLLSTSNNNSNSIGKTYSIEATIRMIIIEPWRRHRFLLPLQPAAAITSIPSLGGQ